MKLDRYDIAMANGASKEDPHPILQNMHLTKGRIEVADGFIILTRELDLEEGEEKPETLLPARMVKGIESGQKQQALLKTDGEKAVVTYQDEVGRAVEFEPALSFKTSGDGKSFPDISQHFDRCGTKKKAHIAVNVGLLKKMLACLPDTGHLRLGITELDKPLEFECSNMDRPIRSMLMPMIIDWEGFKWKREVT